jgi:hypothetical protein
MKLVYMQKYQWRCFSNEVKKQTFRPYKKDLGQGLITVWFHQLTHPNTAALHRSCIENLLEAFY